MALSILHRVTGVGLSVGLLLFVAWLVAVASGSEAYANTLVVFGHPLTKFLFAAFSFSFFYHLCNGVRHLVWDTGHGLERRSARASGWAAFLSAVALTVVFWIVVAYRFTGVA